MCPPPKPPGTVTPPPPTGTHLVIQTGRSVTRIDGITTASYNGTVDASISTQYIADWNNQQVRGLGVTNEGEREAFPYPPCLCIATIDHMLKLA